MNSAQLLFKVSSIESRELTQVDLVPLQSFFEANPLYFLAVNGEPADSNEARQEFEDLPPPEMPYVSRHVMGFYDESQRLVGMASVLSHFLAQSVGHIGLFVVATDLHGTGIAQTIYRALEAWMQQQGAHWIRLGAVVGHTPAERFWEKQGYQEVRRRNAVPMGKKVNDLRVFVKPLGQEGVETYLHRVERDRPDSPSR